MTRSFTPKPATRKGQKLRLAIDGPTGSGKTYSALLTATELGERTLVIDTERGSSQLYADQFQFDVIEFTPPYDPRELRPLIMSLAVDYDTIVVDSLTHFWNGDGGVLDIVDTAGKRQYGGNRYAGWAEGTPAQNDLVDALVSAECHMVVTMRSKMEYVQVDGKVQKVGMAPVQREGLEYEFSIVVDMDLSHSMTIGKTRFSEIADKVYRMGHTVEMIQTVSKILESAEPMATVKQVAEIKANLAAIEDRDIRVKAKQDFVALFGTPETLTQSEAEQAIGWSQSIEVVAEGADDENGAAA